MLYKGKAALLALPLISLFVLGCTGDAGPKGEPGPTGPEGPGGDPSISAVTPGKSFLARKLDVTVSGYNTAWTDAATLDFGPGINVVSKTLASPTAIVASIEVTDKAAIGPRDVVVTDGGKTETYKGAFKVASPLDVGFDGTLAQGSILLAHAKQLDISTPFDTTATGDGVFSPLEYTNIAISTSLDPALALSPDTVSLYGLDFLFFADVKATAGDFGVTVDSGPASGDVISSTSPAAGKLEARQPVALTVGTAATGKIDAPFASLLFSYTPAAPGKILSFDISASSGDATPGIAALPSSGSFADLISYSASPTIVANSTDPFYFVYWDNTGASGYTVSLTPKEIDTQEVEPNDACAKAQKIDLPANLTNLTLSSKSDVDWYAITLADADVGKQIHVVTSPGDDKTDTLVDVFAANCTTSLGGPSDDSDYHEDFLSDKVQSAGTFFVKVSNSPYGYTGTLYNLTVELQ